MLSERREKGLKLKIMYQKLTTVGNHLFLLGKNDLRTARVQGKDQMSEMGFVNPAVVDSDCFLALLCLHTSPVQSIPVLSVTRGPDTLPPPVLLGCPPS